MLNMNAIAHICPLLLFLHSSECMSATKPNSLVAGTVTEASAGAEIKHKPLAMTLRASSGDTSNGKLGDGGSWCPAANDASPYLEVDLGDAKTIAAIGTQGDATVKKGAGAFDFAFSWAHNSETMNSFGAESFIKVDVPLTQKPDDHNTETKFAILVGGVRWMRFYPKAPYGGNACLRIQVYEGCCSGEGCGVSVLPRCTASWDDASAAGQMSQGATGAVQKAMAKVKAAKEAVHAAAQMAVDAAKAIYNQAIAWWA